VVEEKKKKQKGSSGCRGRDMGVFAVGKSGQKGERRLSGLAVERDLVWGMDAEETEVE
jgi:hypothetical protein